MQKYVNCFGDDSDLAFLWLGALMLLRKSLLLQVFFLHQNASFISPLTCHKIKLPED